MKNVLFVVVILLVTISAQAQVLATADTLRKDKQAVMVLENVLVLDGTRANIAYAMYARGLTSKVDLYVSAGQIHLLGQGQVWLGIGGNAHLGKIAGNSLSLFGIVSIPLTGRRIGSAVLVNPAIVVSRPLTKRLSVYTGINALIPVGAPSSRFFTPPDLKINVPIGAAIVLGDWTLCGEVDLGRLKAVGVALSRTF